MRTHWWEDNKSQYEEIEFHHFPHIHFCSLMALFNGLKEKGSEKGGVTRSVES